MRLMWRFLCGWICLGAVLCTAGHVYAQDDAAGADDQAMVKLNFPDNTPLKVLADYVGQRLGLNIVYDQQLNGRQITIKAPNAVPADALRGLLESMLRINGLVLVETDVPGLLRITQPAALNEIAVGPLEAGDPMPEGGASRVVTRIYALEHIGPDRVEQIVGPFLSSSGGASLIKLPEHGLVIITDYASNYERIERLLALADQARREVATRFVVVKHMSAAELASQVTALRAAQATVAGQPAGVVSSTLVADTRTNQLIIAARPDALAEIEALVASLDVSLGLETEVYRLSVVQPEHVDEVARELIGEQEAARVYKSVAHEETGLLAVTTTPMIHEQLQTLITEMDAPIPETQSPIRFYKLQNARAIDIAEMLNGIAGDKGLDTVTVDGVGTLGGAFDRRITAPAGNALSGQADESQGGRSHEENRSEARVVADDSTNTVIVIAPPALQPIYEKLIQRLDVRRPQVLIEATIVAMDTTDDFSLGVEFSRSDSVDGGSLLNFSQFGLSAADPVTGALTLNPGVGFNGALLGADIAEVVIQALQRDVRSRVLTRPSVLVNDNAEGELESKDTEPFESVNANTQVATTSLGGESEAGTRIFVKPTISEGDFLVLDYEINLSSFSGDRITTSTGGTLPPARQENIVKSRVTVPDGTTIVVGGLTREIDTETIERIPLLGSIPIVKHAFSSRQTSKRQITLFVFLRPVILRDDKFEDLKVLSGGAAGRAQLPADFPASEPLEIR